MNEIAPIIAAVAALVTAVATPLVAYLVLRVHREVRTLNESTGGQLLAANETRRIYAKQAAGESLTEQEKRHIDTATSGGSL